MFLSDPLIAPSTGHSFRDASSLKKAVVGVGIVELLAALAFFGWALVNTVRADSFDWGICNFSVSFIAAICAIIAGTSQRRSHSVVAACAQVASGFFQALIYGMAAGYSLAKNAPLVALLVPAFVWLVGSLLVAALLVAATVDDDSQARIAMPDRRTGKTVAVVSLVVLSLSVGFWVTGLLASFSAQIGFDWAACAFVLPLAASVVGLFSAFDTAPQLALANMLMLLLGLVSVTTFWAWPMAANAGAPLQVVNVVQLAAWAVVLAVAVGVAWADFAKLRGSSKRIHFEEL